MADEDDGSIIGAIFWMLLISLLLIWLPFFGSLIAGVVGGKTAGGVGSALMAVLLPSVIISVAVFFVATALTAVPLVGVIFGASMLVLIAANVGALLLGAIIGGIMA
jgi:hypothetical protein